MDENKNSALSSYLIDDNNFKLFNNLTNFLKNATLKSSLEFDNYDTNESIFFADLLKKYYNSELSNINILNLKRFIDQYNLEISKDLITTEFSSLFGLESSKGFLNKLSDKIYTSLLNYYATFSNLIDFKTTFDGWVNQLINEDGELSANDFIISVIKDGKAIESLILFQMIGFVESNRETESINIPKGTFLDNAINDWSKFTFLYNSSNSLKSSYENVKSIYSSGILSDFDLLENSKEFIDFNLNYNGTTLISLGYDLISHWYNSDSNDKTDYGDRLYYLNFSFVNKESQVQFNYKYPLFKISSDKNKLGLNTVYFDYSSLFNYIRKETIDKIVSFIGTDSVEIQSNDLSEFTIDDFAKESYIILYGFLTKFFTQLTGVLEEPLNVILENNSDKILYGNGKRNLFSYIVSFLGTYSEVALSKELIFSLVYKKDFGNYIEKRSAGSEETLWLDKFEQNVFFDLQNIRFELTPEELADKTKPESLIVDEFGREKLKINTGSLNSEKDVYALNFLVLYKELNPKYRDILNSNFQETGFCLLTQGMIPNDNEITSLFPKDQGLSVSKNFQNEFRKLNDFSGLFFSSDSDYLFRNYYANPVYCRIASESDLIAYFLGDDVFSEEYGLSLVEQKEVEDFKDIFKNTRDYYYRVLLNKSFINEEFYNGFEKFFISVVAIMRFINFKADSLHDIDSFTEDEVNNFLKTYGMEDLTKIDNFSNKRELNKNLIKYFVPLFQSKGTKESIELLIKIFNLSDSDLEINKYILSDNTSFKTITTNLNIQILDDETDTESKIIKLNNSFSKSFSKDTILTKKLLEDLYFENFGVVASISSEILDENKSLEAITNINQDLDVNMVSKEDSKLLFTEIPYSNKNETQAILGNYSASKGYETTISKDIYWNTENAPENIIMASNIGAEETKYITASISDNIYERYIKSRLVLSAIDYYDDKLMIWKNSLSYEKILNKIDLYDENTMKLDLPSYFEGIKILFRNMILLEKLKIDTASSDSSEKLLKKTFIGSFINSDGVEKFLNKETNISSSAEEIYSDTTGVYNNAIFVDTSKRISKFIALDENETPIFKTEYFLGIKNSNDINSLIEMLNPIEEILFKTFKNTTVIDKTSEEYKEFISNFRIERSESGVKETIPYISLYKRSGDLWEKNGVQYPEETNELSSFGTVIKEKAFSDKPLTDTSAKLNSGDFIFDGLYGLNNILLSNRDLGNFYLNNSKTSISALNTDLFYNYLIEPTLKFPNLYLNGILNPNYKNSGYGIIYNGKNLEELCDLIIDNFYKTEENTLIIQDNNFFKDNTPNFKAARHYVFEDIYEPSNSDDFTFERINGAENILSALKVSDEQPLKETLENIDEALKIVSQKLLDSILFVQGVFESQEFLQFSFSIVGEQESNISYLENVLKLFLSYTTTLNKIVLKEKIDSLSESLSYAEEISIKSHLKLSELFYYDESLSITLK